jgi:hypothetical protein
MQMPSLASAVLLNWPMACGLVCFVGSKPRNGFGSSGRYGFVAYAGIARCLTGAFVTYATSNSLSRRTIVTTERSGILRKTVTGGMTGIIDTASAYEIAIGLFCGTAEDHPAGTARLGISVSTVFRQGDGDIVVEER